MKAWRQAVFLHAVVHRHRRICKWPRLTIEAIEDLHLDSAGAVLIADEERTMWLLRDALKRAAMGCRSCVHPASVIGLLLAKRRLPVVNTF